MVSASAADTLLIDDFGGAGGLSRIGTPWPLVTDRVMGGASAGGLSRAEIDERRALCLRGEVSLENNGGFVQAALDLAAEVYLNANAYGGIRILVRGNGECLGDGLSAG